MRKHLTLALVALIAVDCTVTTAQAAVGAITRFGIYEMAGPAAGPWKVASVTSTSEIHAKQGLHFGVDFQISGITEPSAVVVATLTHPAITKPDGSIETQSLAQMGPFPVRDGRITSSYGFMFDHTYEMMPGVWQIQVTYQGQVVIEKSFNVVAGK